MWVLTGGNPYNLTHIFGTLTYYVAFHLLNLGQGVAISIFMFPVLVLLIVLMARVLGKEGD